MLKLFKGFDKVFLNQERPIKKILLKLDDILQVPSAKPSRPQTQVNNLMLFPSFSLGALFVYVP